MDLPPTHGIAIPAAEEGSKSSVFQELINQAKLPLTHTGRRHATPQAEAEHETARVHSLAATGTIPAARTRLAKTQQTCAEIHAKSYLIQGDRADIFLVDLRCEASG